MENTTRAFIEGLGVEPTLHTEYLLGLDPDRTIEDCFGEGVSDALKQDRTTAMVTAEGILQVHRKVCIARMPVGMLLRQCLITDMKAAGYKLHLSLSPDLVAERIFADYGDRYGEDRILRVREAVLNNGVSVYMGKPYNGQDRLHLFVGPLEP